MRRRAWILHLGLTTIIGTLYFLVPTTTVSKLVLYNGVGLLSVLAIFVGIRLNRPVHLRAWRLVAVGAGSFLLGDVCYYILEAVRSDTPFPSPADALYLMMYPLVIAGLVGLLRRASPGRDWAGLVDVALIAVGTFAVLGILVMDTYVADPKLGLLGRVISLAYPIMDVALLAVAARLAAAVHLRQPSYALLAAGLCSLLVADTIYGVLNSAGSFETGGFADAFWMAFYILIGAAALHPASGREPTVREVRVGRITRARVAVLCVVVVTVPLINLFWGKPFDQVLMNLSSIAMALLVLVRMIGLMRVLQENERIARHEARHDALTGLANRVNFLDHVEQFLRSSHAGTVAVLFIDIDEFKLVNDSLGHHAGDDLLVTVSERLRACVRDVDLVARLSGDEFAILLESAVDKQDAMAVAKRILHHLNQPINIVGRDVMISASVGISVEQCGWVGNADELLQAADVAMYQAKRKGRGRFEMSEPGMQVEALDLIRLRSDLQLALERGQFRLHFQPITRLQDREVVAVEALLRWEHPARGLVTPDLFIPLAEQTGQIVPIGRWVLREACAQLMRWRRDLQGNAPRGLSVNLSVRQLHDPKLLEDVADALAESGLEPSALTLEITESILVEDADRGSRTLEQLKALQVKIAIDDFGTGYSALSYLRRFPVDTIKIDRSFVNEMESSPTCESLLRAIIDMAHTLHMTTVAEGIETKAQEATLARLGCDFGQGFSLARPAPADQIERLLSPSPARRPSSRATSELHADVVASREQLDTITHDLGRLHDDLGLPAMARLRWASAWLSTYEDWDPLAFVLRDRRSGQLEAAALLATRVSTNRIDLVAVGHGPIGQTRFPSRSDRGVRMLAKVIVDHLATLPAPWRLRCSQLLDGDEVALLLAQKLPYAELTADQWVPQIDLRGQTSLTGLLSHNTQRQIRKARNRIAADGQVMTSQTATALDAIAEILPTLEAIHIERDHLTRATSDLDDPRSRELWRRLVQGHAEAGLIEVSSILIDGNVAAYVIALIDGTSYRIFDGHFDTAYGRYSPGRLLESDVLERAISDPRFNEFDWMAGIAPEKILVSNANEMRMRLLAASSAPPSAGRFVQGATDPATPLDLHPADRADVVV